jgi:hypothetical protein
MDAVLGEAIAIAGTLAGATLGVGGGLLISRRERRNSVDDRMRDAFGVYLGAVYPAVSELRELPDVNGLSKVDEAYNRLRGDKATFITTRRRERQIFGDGLRDRAHRIAIAVADLQVLPLPQPVRDAVDVANDYLERLGQRRTPELKDEWGRVHEQLMAAAELLRSN